jgi:hypothetical protein
MLTKKIRKKTTKFCTNVSSTPSPPPKKKRKKKGKKGCLKHFTFIFKLVIKKENTGTQWVMTERGYK